MSPLCLLSTHTAPVDCVAFSPDGTQLADASRDGRGESVVRVWDLAFGKFAHSFVKVVRFDVE